LTSGPPQGKHEPSDDGVLEPLLAEVGEVTDLRTRDREKVTRTDRLTAELLGTGFLVFVAACASQAPLPHWRAVAMALGLVAAYGIARRTEFVATTGSTVPTEPVLVALLFTTPMALVPALVLAGLLLGGALRNGPGGSLHQLMVRAASGWHCAGPVLVLWLSGLRFPALDRWPVLVIALASQFVGDALVAAVRCAALGVPPQRLAEPLSFAFTVDALLAPLSVCAVLATSGSFAILLFVVLPVALLRMLAIDRNQRLSTALTLGKALRSVRDEARADPMTGVANRRAWEEAVAGAERDAGDRREELVTVVLMADIDHLKAVNDAFGHAAGDELLRAFASTLVATAPQGALVARLGGDEFGVLFTSQAESEQPAEDLAMKLRAAMASCTIPCGETVSASIGVACCPPAASVADAIRQADAAAASDKHARRVRRGSTVARPGDALARPGGAQFVLLCRRLPDGENERTGPIFTVDLESEVGELLRQGDMAMYQANAGGADGPRSQDGKPCPQALGSRELDASLRKAIDRKELFLLYQPLYSLADQSLRGAEALMRWADPDRGTVLPADFIPFAEQRGLIGAIDAFALDEACRQLAKWVGTGQRVNDFTMAVNLSGRELTDPTLVQRVASTIETHGVDPSQLCIEITETALIGELGDVGTVLAALSSLGVRIALDDFGTGYSMLAHLQRLSVDVLKIDRSFVEQIGRSDRDHKIVGAITAMAHALGMSVVGEGIETHQQLQELARLGCDEGQGFLLARPLLPWQVAELRRRGSDASSRPGTQRQAGASLVGTGASRSRPAWDVPAVPAEHLPVGRPLR
jgi:diguanylate cyclase (GGDEF)-like protein